jgi:hypothetical protein
MYLVELRHEASVVSLFFPCHSYKKVPDTDLIPDDNPEVLTDVEKSSVKCFCPYCDSKYLILSFLEAAEGTEAFLL